MRSWVIESKQNAGVRSSSSSQRSTAEPDGAVVPLDDLWDREAARICERLGEVTSWQDRFADSRMRSDGAVNGCGPASVHSSGCRPSAPRLVRFDHAAHRLVAGEGAARVAADSGYADQSHLCRDVMAFTGETPTTVADEPFLAVDGMAWPSTRPREKDWTGQRAGL